MNNINIRRRDNTQAESMSARKELPIVAILKDPAQAVSSIDPDYQRNMEALYQNVLDRFGIDDALGIDSPEEFRKVWHEGHTLLCTGSVEGGEVTYAGRFSENLKPGIPRTSLNTKNYYLMDKTSIESVLQNLLRSNLSASDWLPNKPNKLDLPQDLPVIAEFTGRSDPDGIPAIKTNALNDTGDLDPNELLRSVQVVHPMKLNDYLEAMQAELNEAIRSTSEDDIFDGLGKFLMLGCVTHYYDSANYSYLMLICNSVLMSKGLNPMAHFNLDSILPGLNYNMSGRLLKLVHDRFSIDPEIEQGQAKLSELSKDAVDVGILVRI